MFRSAVFSASLVVSLQLEWWRIELRRLTDNMRILRTRWVLAMALTVDSLRPLSGLCIYVYAVKLKEDLAVKVY
jgi:hypothetical protein